MKRRVRSVVLPVLILLCLVMVLLKGVGDLERISRAESKELLRQSVRKATIECYAIEGAYPSRFSYLEENYGVIYDKEKYGIEYSCWSSNVMPTIVVYEK